MQKQVFDEKEFSDTGKIRKVAIYIRVSTPGQIDNTSLGTQEAVCRKWPLSHMGGPVGFLDKGRLIEHGQRD
jgi:hypothetical protein